MGITTFRTEQNINADASINVHCVNPGYKLTGLKLIGPKLTGVELNALTREPGQKLTLIKVFAFFFLHKLK